MSLTLSSFHRLAVAETNERPPCITIASCKNGFSYIAASNCVYVYNIANHIQLSLDSNTRKDKTIPDSKPLRAINFPYQIRFVFVNCDSSVLAVASETLISLLSIEKLHASDVYSINPEQLDLNKVNCCSSIVNFNWSTVDPTLFFYVSIDGTSQLVKANPGSKSVCIIGSTPASYFAKFGSWSPKGKQYALASFGSQNTKNSSPDMACLLQIDPNNLAIKRTIVLQPQLAKLGLNNFEILGLLWCSTTHFLIALKVEQKTLVFHINSPSKTDNVFLNCLEALTGHSKPQLLQQYLFKPLNIGVPFVLCLWSYDSEDLCLIQMPAESSTEVPTVTTLLPLPCSHIILGFDFAPCILNNTPQILCLMHTSANVSLVTAIRPKDDSKDFLALYAKSLIDSLTPPAFKPVSVKMMPLEPTEQIVAKLSLVPELKHTLPITTAVSTSLFTSTVAQPASVTAVQPASVTTAQPLTIPLTSGNQKNQLITSVIPPGTAPETSTLPLAPKPTIVEKVIYVKSQVPKSLCILAEMFTEAILKERVLCGKTWQQLNDLLNKNGKPSLCKINQTQAAIQTVFQFLVNFHSINDQFHLASTEIRTDCLQTIGFLTHLAVKIEETLTEKHLRKDTIRRLCPEAEINLRSVKSKSKNVENSLSQIESQLKELNEQFSRLMKADSSFSQNQGNVSQILQKTLLHNWKLLTFERTRVAKLFTRLELNEAQKIRLCDTQEEKEGGLIKSLDEMQLGVSASAKEQALMEQDSKLSEVLFPKSKWKVNVIKAPKILSEKVVLVPKTSLQKTKSQNLPPVRSPGKIFTNDLNLLGYISPISSQDMGPQFETPPLGEKDKFKFEPISVTAVQETPKPSRAASPKITSIVPPSTSSIPKPVATSIFEQNSKDSKPPITVIPTTPAATASTTTLSATSICGAPATQTTTAKSMFGQFSSSNLTTTSQDRPEISIPQTTTGPVSSLFGQSVASKPVPASLGLFGTATTSGGTFPSNQSSIQEPNPPPASQLFATSNPSGTGLFSVPSQESKPTGNFFDSPSSAKPGLFVSSQQTSNTGSSLFGSPQKSSTTNSNLFMQQNPAPSSGSLFSSQSQATVVNKNEQKRANAGLFSSSVTSGSGLFSTPQSQSKPSPGMGLFEAASQQPSGGLFGASTATSSAQPQIGSLFGSTPDNGNQLSSIFGQATSFGSSAPKQQSDNVFSKASSKDSNVPQGLFGESKPSGGLFGTSSTNQHLSANSTGWFGNSNSNEAKNQSSGGLFSGNVSMSTGSLFGSQSAFGALAANNPLGGMATSSQSNSAAQGGLFGGFQSSATSGEGLFSSLAKQAGQVNAPLQPSMMGNSTSFTQRRA